MVTSIAGGDLMTRPSGSSKIYELGVWIGYLEARVSPDQTNWGIIKEALQALNAYKTIDGLESIGTEAQSQLYSLSRKYKYSNTRLFAKEDREALMTLINHWCGRLEEVKKRWLTIIPNLSIDVSKLSSGAKSFFSEDEWSRLNDLEQKSLDEAAYCMLSNNFTASEFMALRTVESVLRRWYKEKTGKTDYVHQSNIIDLLDEEFPERGGLDKEKRPKEISALFHLKNRRNAIAHPEVISTYEDANATFVYVINTCKLASLLAVKTS